jgi:hypothetical protein
MGFLDKAKESLTKATETAKEKIDDVKDKKKANDLLDELGRIVLRQHTGRAKDGDDAEITRLVGELQALESQGVDVLGTGATASPATPPPATPGSTPVDPGTPPPPPPMPT